MDTRIRSLGRFRLRSRAAFIAVMLIATVQVAHSQSAGKRLDHVTGVTGFATAPGAPLHQVFGREILADDQYAVTRAASAAELVLPDSSIVALGQNTLVQVGAFDSSTNGPGATIAVQGGALRFDVRRPQGGVANYRFTTNTSQIAVRGTVGLLSLLNGTTTVACLVCQADSVSIVTGGRTIALANGQFVTIAADGSSSSGTVTQALLTAFQAEYVSTVADSGAAADTIALSTAHAATVLPAVAGAAVAAGAGIAIATQNSSINGVRIGTPTATPTAGPGSPTNAPTNAPTGTPTVTPTATPVPTATPTAGANVGIEGSRHANAPIVPATSAPAPPRGHTR